MATIAETFHDHWVEDANGCWIWQRACKGKEVINGGGYGCLSIKGKCIGAHRYSYELEIGSIPKGLQIRHTCHNTKCVNPAHMLLGTNADNMHDKALVGHAANKLTIEQVRTIKFELLRGTKQQVLADKFIVDQSTIADINTGRTWKHVD